MSASWILKLNQSDSRLHKEEVVRQALTATKLGSVNAQNFLELTKAAYDPYITYGIRQVPDTAGIIDAENPWSEFKGLLVDLSHRKFTGHAARDAVQAMADRFDSEEWNVFCAAVLRRDLRAGVSDKTINKICKKTEYEIPIFGCQLAANSEGRPEMKGIKRLEPKLDGVRVLMMVFTETEITICFSRNGKMFDNFTHIEDQVKKHTSKLLQAFKNVDQGRGMTGGFVLDGEVIGKSFQELMRQARRKEKVQATDSVFNIFDIIPLEDFQNGYWNAQLSKRIDLLEAMRTTIDDMPNVELLPHIMVDLDTAAGKDQLMRYAKDQVNAGFEGIMVKDCSAPYECKRNTF